jgi:3-dehydroquinate dehydratase-1
MRPCLASPLQIRAAAFGGPKPLFCVPLVAGTLDQLLGQAHAVRPLMPDVVEWRADSYEGADGGAFVGGLRELRAVLDPAPVIFTLRASTEGGVKTIPQEVRAGCIDAVLRSGQADIVDIELSNGPGFLQPLIETAHANAVRLILSFHDFSATPRHESLLATIAAMVRQGGDIAKIACMPKEPGDVLRLLQATLAARHDFPTTPLCTMAMGGMGSISRVAGFLYGSDMAFAVGQAASAPGQIPIAEARALAEGLLRYA